MRRFGTITLMLFAFVVGFASTYSCGGGGSSSDAADYAPLVHEHDAADISSGVLDISLIPSHSHAEYADSNHTHTEYMDTVVSCSSGEVLKWNGSAWECSADLDSTDAETLDGLDSSDFATTDDLNYLESSIQSAMGITQTGYVSIRHFPSYDNQTIKEYNVSLPHTAVIKKFTYYYNDDRSDIDVDALLVRFDLSANTTETLATVVNPPGFDSGLGSSYSTSIDYPYVDNLSYSYFVTFRQGFSLGAVIEYDYKVY